MTTHSKARVALILLAAACIAASGACKKAPVDEPGAFTYGGVPIHPAAINALYRSQDRTLDLAAFQTPLEYQSWEEEIGWWITDYETDPVSGKTPFFAYAAYANPANGQAPGGAEDYILAVTFNGGETPADVNNILRIQKTGSWLTVARAWEEGSACDGGIFAQRAEGDNFFYSRELTPIDFLELSAEVRFDLVPHEDLEAGVESCAAAANYVYRLVEDREELVSVRLYEEPRAVEAGITEKFRFQSCFNKIFNSFLTAGRTALGQKDVDEFARRFRDECLTVNLPTPADELDR